MTAVVLNRSHVLLWSVVDRLSLNGHEGVKCLKAALPLWKLRGWKAHLSRARSLMLLQLSANHKSLALHTLDPNLIEKAVGKTALTSDQSLHATQRAGFKGRDAGAAEQMTTCVALSRITAELCTNRALEFANQVDVVEIYLSPTKIKH